MVLDARKLHAVSPYSVLGLETLAPPATVDAAYRRLARTLKDEKFLATPQSWVQAQQVSINIENAYKRIVDGDIDEEAELPGVLQNDSAVYPKLGQLLVAAGLITLDQLNQAIEKQKTTNLKIGEILKDMSLINQTELDSFLLNQRLIKLPIDSPYYFGTRLIGLGLVTEDMVRIALVELRKSNKSLGQILVDRNWLARDILDALLEPASQDTSAGSCLK